MADPSKANPTTFASKFYFLEATVMRRSTIDLKKDSPISDARIEEIVKYAMLHTPSPFHAQSGRLVILRHRDHEKIRDMAYELASKTNPPALFHSRISPSLKSYKASHGMVPFYDDPEAVNAMLPMLGNLIKTFPEWGEYSNGMAQYVGLGYNLQHYQKGLTEKNNAEWSLPAYWELRTQLFFGTPNGPPMGGVEK